MQNVPLLDFMPTFAIAGEDPVSKALDWNNKDYWTWNYIQKSEDADGNPLEPIMIEASLCKDVIS